MDPYNDDEGSENLIYFLTNKSLKGKFKSRLGRRNKIKEAVTHPQTPASSCSVAKQGEALKDIANILQEPNPVLNDSFSVSDSSSTANTQTSNFSESFKTPGRSFYKPCIDDSPIDALRGIIMSPRESPLTLFYSPAVTLKKNYGQKTLFGRSIDSNKSLEITKLDERKLPIGVTNLNSQYGTSSTHPPSSEHTPIGSFSFKSSTVSGSSHKIGGFKGKNLFNSAQTSMEDRSIHQSSENLQATPLFSLFKSDGPECDERVVKSAMLNDRIDKMRESLTDTIKQTHDPHHSERLHKTEEMPFSLSASGKSCSTNFAPFLKPTPEIDQIARNISSHFLTNSKDMNCRSDRDSTKEEEDSLDHRISNINLSHKVKFTPSSELKTPGRSIGISSLPLNSCNQSGIPGSKHKADKEVSLNSQQNSNFSHPFQHQGSIPFQHEASTPDHGVNDCHDKFINRNKVDGSMESHRLGSFSGSAESNSSREMPHQEHGFKFSEQNQGSDHQSALEMQQGDVKTKDASNSIVNGYHSFKSHHNSGKKELSFQKERLISMPNGVVTEASQSSLSSSSGSYSSASTALCIDQVDSSGSGHSELKSKPFSNSLFQASVLRHESSILDSSDMPLSSGCRSSLFQSSIIGNHRDAGLSALQPQTNNSNHLQNSSLFHRSVNNQANFNLKPNVVTKPVDNRPLVFGGEIHRGQNYEKTKEDALFKKPIIERNVDVFRKPTSIVPRAIKNNSNLPEVVHVNGVGYPIISLLGQGGSSKVYQALGEKNKFLAIKCVNLQSEDELVAKGYLNEINLLEKLQDCSTVIKLFSYEHKEQSKQLFVVMEKGEIDFAQLTKSITRTKKISMPMIVYYWTEMLNCVNDIHKIGVIHSDLKPANFLLVLGRLKLIDFGIASPLQEDMTSVIKDCTAGTFNYMSPEAITSQSATQRGHRLSLKSDIWSLGCILYQLLYGKTPYSHIPSLLTKMHAIVDPSCLPSYPNNDDIPISLQVALRWCLKKDPKLRPTTSQLLKIPYLTPPCQSTAGGSNMRFHQYALIAEMLPECSVELNEL